jgi:hypothetical protein
MKKFLYNNKYLIKIIVRRKKRGEKGGEKRKKEEKKGKEKRDSPDPLTASKTLSEKKNLAWRGQRICHSNSKKRPYPK